MRPVRALALGAVALAGCQVVINLDDKVYVDASADGMPVGPEAAPSADGGLVDDATVSADAASVSPFRMTLKSALVSWRFAAETNSSARRILRRAERVLANCSRISSSAETGVSFSGEEHYFCWPPCWPPCPGF